MTEEQINKLSPYHRDFLEVWGNQWTPKRVMPGTCLACVWGEARYSHAADCPVRLAMERQAGFRQTSRYRAA